MKTVVTKTVIILLILLFCEISAQSIITVIPKKDGTPISEALVKARSGDTIIVSPGLYKEQITIPTGVYIKSEKLHKTIINGKGRGTAVILSSHSTIDGLDIVNSTSAIVTKGLGTTIKNCRIYKNSGSAILCTENLPEITNNLIVFNEGSGVQAVGIKSGSTKISNNTIAYNFNTGISIDGRTPISISNNIISNNSSFAIKINEYLEKIIKISHNVIFKNQTGRIFIPQNNSVKNPRFKKPKRKEMNFSLMKDSPAIGMGSDGNNPGVNF